MIRTFALAIMFALAACDQSASQVQDEPQTYSAVDYQADELGAQLVRMDACYPQFVADHGVQFCNILIVHRNGEVVRVSRIDRTERYGNRYGGYVVFIEERDTGVKLNYMDWQTENYHGQAIGQTIVGFVQYGDARYPELERHALSGTLIGT